MNLNLNKRSVLLFTTVLAMSVLTYPCGTEYRGELVNGIPQGRGYLCLPTGVVCQGMFCDGEAHGLASQVMPNGDVYTGGFARGRRDGRGTYAFAKGMTVRGTWVDGVFLRTAPYHVSHVY